MGVYEVGWGSKEACGADEKVELSNLGNIETFEKLTLSLCLVDFPGPCRGVF